ncbi:MAG: acyl carrier protein, partial [Lachnospiraceae bacterium]|nr:acyl carrier protein [Lachnospiraceae bacterium]
FLISFFKKLLKYKRYLKEKMRVNNPSKKLEENKMFKKIQDLLVEELDLERDTIKPETGFEELGLDSLDIFQLINDLEDELDIKIETDADLKTISDLVTYVEKKVAEK